MTKEEMINAKLYLYKNINSILWINNHTLWTIEWAIQSSTISGGG